MAGSNVVNIILYTSRWLSLFITAKDTKSPIPSGAKRSFSAPLPSP